jgi:hypothetical protein
VGHGGDVVRSDSRVVSEVLDSTEANWIPVREKVLLSVLEINRVGGSKKVLERQAADKLALLRGYPIMTSEARSTESAEDECDGCDGCLGLDENSVGYGYV